MSTFRYTVACAAGLWLAGPDAAAQLAAGMMPRPMTSPKASASQRVGLTDVAVSYHRPGAKGRELWGDVVPYDEVWRCGANENTTISFTDPVRVEGVDVPAGTYGLHAIPTPGTWTIMLSSNATAWGSYTYDPSEDVARVTVTPTAAPFQEWLGYEFVDLSDTSATLQLRWGELAVPLRLEVDTHAIVIARTSNEYLRGIAQWTWEGWHQAAKYCLEHQVALEQGLDWAQRSVGINAQFDNLWTLGELQQALEQDDAASESFARALDMADEAQRNRFGRRLLEAGRVDEAIRLLEQNTIQYPRSWRALDSLASVYDMQGDVRRALELYTKALALADGDAEVTARLTEQIERLEN